MAWSSRPPFCLSYFTCSFLPQGLCTCHFLYLAHSSLLFAKVTPTPLLLSFQHPSYNLALTGRPSWVDSPCHRLSLLSTVLDWFEPPLRLCSPSPTRASTRLACPHSLSDSLPSVLGAHWGPHPPCLPVFRLSPTPQASAQLASPTEPSRISPGQLRPSQALPAFCRHLRCPYHLNYHDRF